MKKHKLLFALFIGLSCTMLGQTLTQKFYFDFGPIDGTNGDVTVNPDKNTNYWNNLPNLSGSVGTPSFSNLKNSANGSTNYGLTFTVSGFITNGKLNGALLSPVAANFGTDSDLAIATATEDYIYTTSASNGPTFKLTGLDPLKQYRFKLFASRNVTTTRTSQYTIQGAGTAVVGTLNSSSTGSGANLGTIYTSSYITPTLAGEISITTITTTLAPDNFAYINCMKMEEFAVNQVDATSISVSGNDISSAGANSQMSVVYVPSNATIHSITWSVDDTSVATISSSGLLTPKKNGTVTVNASFVQNSQTISASKQISISNQTTELYVSGTATSNGDNPSTALQMNAAVGTGGILTGVFEFATTLNASGTLKFYTSRTDLNAPVYGAGASAGTILLGGVALTPNVSGKVLIRVYLATNTYKIYPINGLKISQMGSSVSYGTGATSNHGYAWLYSQLLAQRNVSGNGLNWTLSNISVPGNNTTDLLNRWDNDLLNDGSQYVVYALSLGNEGIVGGGQAVFDQFKNNMLLMISKARSVGKIPIIANCYVRADFGASEYNYVKQMDLLIHDWDVPSINLLGAIDDGTGKWPVSPLNYQFDANHPNDAGHAELFYSIVPSVFDALNAGKAQPQLYTNTYLSSGKASNSDKLVFSPENIIHPFTLSVDIRTTFAGTISSFKQGSTFGTVLIESSGCVSYVSPTGLKITGTSVVNDGQWHKITLTHYYAWGQTILYIDNTESGRTTEKLTASDFYLNDINAPANIDYRNWMFYRAGMNASEIAALCSSKMLKSSLELYAPLDGQHLLSNDTLLNLAQSTNTIQRIGVSTATSNLIDDKILTYPNPAGTLLNISGLKQNCKYDCTIFGLDGKTALKRSGIYCNQLDVSNLQSGYYYLSLKNKLSNEIAYLNFLKK